MIYYVYMYLREDGSPYYVGQGKDDRWRKRHNCVVPPKERVLFVEKNTTKEWATFVEMELIDEYGRINDGTGILENLCDGGQKGPVGMIHSEETKKVIAKKSKDYGICSRGEVSTKKLSSTVVLTISPSDRLPNNYGDDIWIY